MGASGRRRGATIDRPADLQDSGGSADRRQISHDWSTEVMRFVSRSNRLSLWH
jgi:hypothetical protein